MIEITIETIGEEQIHSINGIVNFLTNFNARHQMNIWRI